MLIGILKLKFISFDLLIKKYLYLGLDLIAFIFLKINLYVCRYFIFFILLCLIIILCITSLFEGIELLRRTISRTGTPLSIITEMIFLKLPTHLNTLLPFTIFFSAILSLSRLIQSRELTVIRATVSIPL